MSNAEERLMQWRRDAHAMEKQAEQMLSGLAGREMAEWLLENIGPLTRENLNREEKDLAEAKR